MALEQTTPNVPGLGLVSRQDVNQIAAALSGSTPSGGAISPTFSNLTLTGLLFESAATGITAGTTRTQAGATALTKEVSRVDTSTAPTAGSTLGDGVVLMASVAGLDATVINNTANIIQVYGNGTDSINGVAGATGVPIPPGDVAQFECSIAGDWRFDAGVGASGNLPLVLAVTGVSAAGGGQAGATQLVADFNKITTATAGQGVALPAAKAGLDIIVENHTGVQIMVYGNNAAADTIDDVATATGVNMMDSSVVIFTCYENGKWYTNGLATGYAKNPQSGTVLETMQFSDGVSAAGTTQGTATQLTAALNTVSTVASGTGVNLPASAPGLAVTVQNTGANPLLVYPAQGATDTINGQAATVGVSLFPGVSAVFNCTAAGAWTVQPGSTNSEGFNSVANSDANFTLTAAQITGGVASVDTVLTGAITAGRNATLPTVAALVAALHAPTVGTSYRLRITNAQANAQSFTVTTNTGWTLTGTMTIAQNTWREFSVKLTSLTAATLQNLATGTFS